MKTYVYTCTNVHCRQYHKELRWAASPSEHRFTTGRFASCNDCGDVLNLVRVEPATASRNSPASRTEQNARYLDCGPLNWDDTD